MNCQINTYYITSLGIIVMATAQHGKGGAHILIKMTLKCIILHWLSLGATPMHHLVP